MRVLATATLVLAALAPTATRAATPAPCDPLCQQRENALPRTEFYRPPDPLPPRPSGTLIRAETFDGYRVGGAAVTATRILYHSRTSAGRDVAASGVVLLPPGPPPAGGWPVVADAHGTSGVDVGCAPSLMRDLYHGDQMLRFVARGWAVVAPDYAGLGTGGGTEFLDKTAASNDVLAAVRAASQLPLSARWVLWGHSQGGGAALAVAERQHTRPDPGYLGAVVTAPAADLVASVESIVATPGLGAFLPLIAYGAKITDPRTRLRDVLSPAALRRLPAVRTECLGALSVRYAGLTGAGLVRPRYLTEPHFARFLAANSVGSRPVGGPVLLLQGDADQAIPAAITDRVASRLCRTGSDVDYRTLPGLGHDTIPGVVTGIDDGAADQLLAWVADRFAGWPAGSTCAQERTQP
jgi:alpha-beta hydrolase superfamily lysophospholipase